MCQLPFRFFAEYVLAKVTQHPVVPSFLVNVYSRWRTKQQQHTQGYGIPALILSLRTLRKMYVGSKLIVEHVYKLSHLDKVSLLQ